MTSNTWSCNVVSKSLIHSEKVVLSEDVERKFCLGLVGWCPCRVCSPRMEKKSLCLKRTRERLTSEVYTEVDHSEEVSNKVQKLDERFDFNVTSDKVQKLDERFDFSVTSNNLTRFMEGEIPANTERCTSWAVKVFEEWRKARNSKFPTDLCPENIFTHEDSKIICCWLCKFIAEVRKVTGKEYTPRSLYLILSGLQRHMRKLRPLDTIDLFHDIHYKPVKNVCDSVFKQLHQKGIGTETKETPVLSQDDEDELWKKAMNLDSPIGLLRAVFFAMAKTFVYVVAKSREI